MNLLNYISKKGDVVEVFESDLIRLITELRFKDSNLELRKIYSANEIRFMLYDTVTGVFVTKIVNRFDYNLKEVKEEMKKMLIDAICS